ncbi:CatB-related O-acetyltransferase [Lactovum miscens]|uniref:Acetyltransferase-like isoleucine patch superfamily enzyme n=1 Tax=Lactovum miscens TaxID=190387 RepID=A0A841C238_9LACT|nr:CatB-related O-acetyltransferase [Lactovum miscens]MBB5887996.1 acetyltransferase-like isoleucine patch superfamily enzyme [Lactovum miscens]
MNFGIVYKCKRRIQVFFLNRKGNRVDYSVTTFSQCHYEGAVSIFYNCYISSSDIGYGSLINHHCQLSKTKIGRYSCLAPYCNTMLTNHPVTESVATSSIFYSDTHSKIIDYNPQSNFKSEKFTDNLGKYTVEIGNDCWLGLGVKILNSIKIGDGAVIAAGAVVTKDVPPYAIVGGVPAKIIKYRFTEDLIEKLLKIKWWDWDINTIKERAKEFDDIYNFVDTYYKN